MDPLSLVVEAINADSFIARQNRIRARLNKPPLTDAEVKAIQKNAQPKPGAYIWIEKERDDDRIITLYGASTIDDKEEQIESNWKSHESLVKRLVDGGFDIYDLEWHSAPQGVRKVVHPWTAERTQAEYAIGQAIADKKSKQGL